MSFDSPLVLLLAPLAGVALGFLGAFARRRRLRAAMVWAPAAGERGPLHGWMPWLLGGAGLVAMAGAAGPRWGRTSTQMEGRALNLAIGVDISRSMLAEDDRPNRLQRAVREAERLVQDSRGERIGLLAFAGRSYILTPLTLDDGAVTLQLDALDPEIASEGGTDLAAVLQQGRDLLNASSEGGARVLVLFTDGEAHDSIDAILAAAREVRSSRISLVLVAAGDTVPVRIPLRDERGQLTGYKTDADGLTVRTARTDWVLRALADAAGGTLVSAETGDQAGAVARVLSGLERSAVRERRREDLTPRGWLFALGAIALLGLHGALRKGPALAAIALVLLPAARADAQRPSPGDRLLRRGDTAGAALAYAREAARRPDADTAIFNAGTAALARGELREAREWLAVAARSLDPEVRFRALYNVGLAAMIQARSDTAERAALNQEAATRFKEALLLNPGSLAAKWNLELVQPPVPPPSGGGGSKPPPTPPRTPPQPEPRSGALSPREAEQILNSVERAERDVRTELARRRRVAQSNAGKDW